MEQEVIDSLRLEKKNQVNDPKSQKKRQLVLLLTLKFISISSPSTHIIHIATRQFTELYLFFC